MKFRHRIHPQKRLKHIDEVAEVEELAEFEIMEKDIAKALTEFKGKKIVVDKDGKVIHLKPVKYENLPPFSLTLGLNIATPSEGTLGGRRMEGVSAGKKKKTVIRVAGSRAIDDILFQAANTLATTLSNGEKVIANAGVSLRVGDQVKEGPALPSDPKKLSRKKYFERSLGGNNSQESLASYGFNANGSTDSFLSNDDVGGASRVPLKQNMFSYQFVDIDALEGGKKVTKQQPGQGMNLEQQMSSSLLSTVSTHTILPQKASDRQFENVSLLSGGVDKSHPRDRNVPRSMIPPSERKHLPPPRLGKTTG